MKIKEFAGSKKFYRKKKIILHAWLKAA